MTGGTLLVSQRSALVEVSQCTLVAILFWEISIDDSNILKLSRWQIRQKKWRGGGGSAEGGQLMEALSIACYRRR